MATLKTLGHFLSALTMTALRLNIFIALAWIHCYASIFCLSSESINLVSRFSKRNTFDFSEGSFFLSQNMAKTVFCVIISPDDASQKKANKSFSSKGLITKRNSEILHTRFFLNYEIIICWVEFYYLERLTLQVEMQKYMQRHIFCTACMQKINILVKVIGSWKSCVLKEW